MGRGSLSSRDVKKQNMVGEKSRYEKQKSTEGMYDYLELDHHASNNGVALPRIKCVKEITRVSPVLPIRH